jgi:uncharacterized protein (TIGR02001 family)
MTGAALAGGSLKDEPKSEREFTYSFTLTGTSDYVYRGISQTDNDPTVQAGATFGYGILYAGIWGSGVDFFDEDTGKKGDIEIDYFAGIKPTWGAANFDFGILWYTYPGWLDKSDYIELKAGVSGEVLKGLTAGGTVYYGPGVNDVEYWAYEGTLAYALPKVWVFDPTVSALVGFQDNFGFETTDYTYWNAGLTLTVDKLSFDFRYWDTDLTTAACGFSSNCSERFVFSATVALP